MKIYKRFLVSFIFISITFVSFSYESWWHSYFLDEKTPLGRAYSIPLSDGGFAFAASWFQEAGYNYYYHPLYVWKTDSHGNLLWVKRITTEEVKYAKLVEETEGSFVVFFIYYDTFPYESLVSFDLNGNIKWQKRYSWISDGWELFLSSGVSGKIYCMSPDGAFNILDQFGNPICVKLYGDGEGNYLFPGADPSITVTKKGDIYMVANYGNQDKAAIVKTDSEENIKWSRCFELVGNGSGSNFFVSPTADEGVLVALPTADDSASVLVKLDKDGNSVWQKNLFFRDSTGYNKALSIIQVAENEDGKIVVTADEYSYVFFGCLTSQGETLWTAFFEGNYDNYYGNFISINGALYSSGMTLGEIYDPPHIQDYIGSCFGKLSYEDIGSDDCFYSRSICSSGNIQDCFYAEEASIEVYQCELSEYLVDEPEVWDSNLAPVDVAVTDIIDCGIEFPGIMSVKKLSNPFRLKLTGWNFEKGSKVYIDGEKAGIVEYKGKDEYQRTKLLLSGEGLKKKLPKGKEVCIEVINKDGNQSDCFYFTR